MRHGFSGPAFPGVTCLVDGNTNFKTTWAVEINYYMDLGFLPENMQYFVDQRPCWLLRTEGRPERIRFGSPAHGTSTPTVEFNSEPIRLTFDACKAIWGPKYSHFVDVWVAYRYWQNKFGLDHNASPASAPSACGRS